MPYLSVEREGRVATVTIANPPTHFMNGEMVAELDELVRSLEGDRRTGAVVLTGSGDGFFLAHYDVAEILARSEGTGPPMPRRAAAGALRAVGAVRRLPGAGAAARRTPIRGLVELRRIHDLFLRMNRMDIGFVAALNGTAMGGGCELALACDVRIMAEGPFRIGIPEISLGFIPGAGGTERLTRTLGAGRALRLMLEARVLSPSEAAEVGMVHEVVPPERLLETARESAELIASRPPAAVGALKRAVYEGGSLPLAAGLHVERSEFVASGSQEECRALMREFVAESERLGDRTPWSDPEAFERWRRRPAPGLG